MHDEWYCRIGCGAFTTRAYRDEHFKRCHPHEYKARQFNDRQYFPHLVCQYCDGCFHTKADLHGHECETRPVRICEPVTFTQQGDLAL